MMSSYQPLMIFLLICLNEIRVCLSGGALEITLQNYRLEFGRNNGQNPTPSPTDNAPPLTVKDYAKTYQSEWRLAGVFNVRTEESNGGDSSMDIGEFSVTDFPWSEPTDCGAPARYRYLVCLDYADNFDPARPCRLERIQTELIQANRVPFRPQFGRDLITFDNLLGMTPTNDVIPNPIKINFDLWKGPLRLSVYVRCCGSVSVIEDQCQEVLTTTITTWPRPAVQGKSTLRYAMDGRASLTFAVSATCDDDYYGRSCDLFCQVKNPAVEHAFCNVTTGSRQCLKGWQGLDCQIDTDECQGLVCQNGGTCINSQGTYSCKCPFSTRGRRCERRYPVCHLQPCQHQGSCLETPSGSLCLCLPGFQGQWCHLLEGQEATGSRVTSLVSTVSPPGNGTGVGVAYTQGNGDSQRTTTNKGSSSSAWHHWYLAIIVACILLVCLILIIIFLAYRSRVRRQYKVSMTVADQPGTTVTPGGKPRVFGNAVYQKEDTATRVIKPFFYEPKNLHSNNNNNNNNNNNSNQIHNDVGFDTDTKRSKPALLKTNNVEIKSQKSKDDKPAVLDVKALLRKPTGRVAITALDDDHRVGYSDRLSLTQQGPSEDVHMRDRFNRKGRGGESNAGGGGVAGGGGGGGGGGEHSRKMWSGYEMATLRRSMQFSPNDESVEYRSPRPTNSRVPSDHYEPQKSKSMLFSLPPLSDPLDADYNDGGLPNYDKNPFLSHQPTPQKSRDLSPSKDASLDVPYFKQDPKDYYQSIQTSTTIQMTQRGQSSSHYKAIKPTGLVREHEYEDINPDYNFRPVPKPRQLVQQGQQDTMQIRPKKNSFPQEAYIGQITQDNNSVLRQLYPRRCSDGLIDERTRTPSSRRYIPASATSSRTNEWDSSPHQHPHQQQQHQRSYNRHGYINNSVMIKTRFDHPYVSTGDLRYFPGGNMMSLPQADASPNPNANNSSTRVYSNLPRGCDSSDKAYLASRPPIACPRSVYGRSVSSDVIVQDVNLKDGQLRSSKRRRSGVISTRFSLSRRNSKQQIYRNTDMAGFDAHVPTPSRDKAGGNSSSSSSNYLDDFSPRQGKITASRSPKATDRLFGKRRLSELRRDSETSLDISLWQGRDEALENRPRDGRDDGYQSNGVNVDGSAFV